MRPALSPALFRPIPEAERLRRLLAVPGAVDRGVSGRAGILFTGLGCSTSPTCLPGAGVCAVLPNRSCPEGRSGPAWVSPVEQQTEGVRAAAGELSIGAARVGCTIPQEVRHHLAQQQGERRQPLPPTTLLMGEDQSLHAEQDGADRWVQVGRTLPENFRTEISP